MIDENSEAKPEIDVLGDPVALHKLKPGLFRIQPDYRPGCDT